jgi:DNA-binding response OmpR family regulator
MAKILIIDDDKDILEVVQLLLTTKGYDVQTIFNAEETLDKIKSFNPEVILLDVNIGQHDGREICKLLKSVGTIKHIPVILFSALPGLEHTYPECEATGYIAKPFDANHLFETIERHLITSKN